MFKEYTHILFSCKEKGRYVKIAERKIEIGWRVDRKLKRSIFIRMQMSRKIEK